METIWGEIQTSHRLADGVVDVTTASHGGIIVDKKVANNFLSKEAISIHLGNNSLTQFLHGQTKLVHQRIEMIVPTL